MIPSPPGEGWNAMKGVAPMTTTKRAVWFGVAAVAIAVLYVSSVARLGAQQPGGAVVSIDGGGDLTKLVGRKGEVLDALQELTRLAVHQKTGERSRLMLDIARWRRRRRDELAVLGDKVARRVLESGEREELTPMTPFERKIVHDAVAAVDGVHSESEGVEPSRRVVVLLD